MFMYVICTWECICACVYMGSHGFMDVHAYIEAKDRHWVSLLTCSPQLFNFILLYFETDPEAREFG